MYIFKKIFNVERNYSNKHKLITILGIKFKILKKDYVEHSMTDAQFKKIILEISKLREQIVAMKINAGLEKYRGIYEGKDIVIVGGGPSLEYFEPIDNAIYIGVNRAFKMKNINFDYLFLYDALKEGMEDFINYNPKTCKKMIGFVQYGLDWAKLDLKSIKTINGEIFAGVTPRIHQNEDYIPYDITMAPLPSFGGTCFAALSFALFTFPRRIYLAGFDCTDKTGNYFYDKANLPWYSKEFAYSFQQKGWISFKKHIERFYPETEIISINPVKLKGMFNDYYTESYIRANSKEEEEKRLINA